MKHSVKAIYGTYLTAGLKRRSLLLQNEACRLVKRYAPFHETTLIVSINGAHRCQMPIMRPINTVTTGRMLRTGDFDRLFRDSRKYTEFLNDIDRLPRRILPGKLNDVEEYDPRVLQLYASGFNRIAAMFTESNIARYKDYYSMLRTGLFAEHGFDLATSSEIQ